MGRVKPLARFPIVATNRVEEAEVEITRWLTDVSIMRVADRDRFELQMNGVNIGRTSLVFNRFGIDTNLKARFPGDAVLFIIGGSAPTTFILDDESVVVSPQKAAMIKPAQQMQIERSESSEILVLRTSLSELLHHFEELTARHHRGPLIFDHSINLTNGPGAMLKRMMNNLAYELKHNDLVLKNPGLRKSYDHMLLAALLSLPHNHRKKLYEDRRYQVAPGLVRRAEEYMRVHFKEAITINDLLRICGCSRSVLFAAFRNARGYTPMEFLTEHRLQSAREKLLKPHPEVSVSSIALDCGFMYLGRFSQVYRKRFGERPSDTWRKRRQTSSSINQLSSR
ncbi:MAG: AraC family transcriptional regulator [Syntrophobacteria bacterium]